MSGMLNRNVYTEHPLIERQQTYVLERKLVTIHSEDRDVCAWPNSSFFEITLPQQLTNVQSIRLIESNFPSVNNVFTNTNQNTKMTFYVDGQEYTITIDEGFYSPNQIANELTNKMNQAVSVTTPGYSEFSVIYHEVNQKIWFGNKSEAFYLLFDKVEDYSVSGNTYENCKVLPPNELSTCMSTKWGLPYYLGFNRQEYVDPIATTSDLNYEYKKASDIDYTWLPVSGTGYYIVAPNVISIFGETTFYMDLFKYNDMDELMPYPRRTNASNDNSYGGRVNNAFAKIPILGIPVCQYFDSRNSMLQNMSQFFPPLERLSKIKVRFRYHDGRLVDFSNCDFSFTLEFDLYRDEMARDLRLRIPAQYRM
jgi:hypothetical protein